MGRLDKDSPLPLYHQLKSVLLAAIETGELSQDQQLPNENQLADEFGVSKITVRQALRELAHAGYIRREQGRGTFVTKPSFGQGPRELTSFTEEMRRRHLSAAARVLDQREAEADEQVAAALQIPTGSRVFVLKRLRIADGQPMGIQTAHVPLDFVPGITGDAFEDVSLYAILERRYGLKPVRARETYCVDLAHAEEAELLGIAPGAPVFVAERVALLPNGKPFEYVQSTMRGDRYKIVLDLVKDRERL